MNKRLLTGCLVVALTLCLPLTLLTGFSGLGYFFGPIQEQPEQVDILVTAGTASLGVGEAGLIIVEVTNLADQPQSLNSIDIAQSYLEGISLQKSTPPPQETGNYPEFESYFYVMDIPPGETLVVEITILGAKKGTFPGWIDVCMNQTFQCMTFEGALTIQE